MSTTLLVNPVASDFLVLEDVEDGTVVAIEAPNSGFLEVIDSGMQGPTGAAGAGGAPTRVDFTSSGTWSYTHNLGRVPFVLAYLSDGHPLLADMTVTTLNLAVVHATPVAGFVLFF